MKVRHPAFKEIIKDIPDPEASSWLDAGWEQVVEAKFHKGGLLAKPKRVTAEKVERVLSLEDTQEFVPEWDD